jgi:quinol monooxygenase YgiN
MSAVRLVINLHTVPGAAEEYCAAWLAHGDEVRAEQGCLQYELFRSASDPDNLVMVELWADRAAFDAHWTAELARPPVRPDLIGRPDTRRYGRDGVEIYWEHAEQRWSGSAGQWVRRPGS